MKPLNLLPQREREIVRLRFIQRFLQFWALWFIVLALFGVILMVAAAVVVRFQEQSFAQQVEALFSQRLLRDIAEREEVVNGANERLLKVRSILEGREVMHSLLIDIVSLVPSGITLEIVIYDQKQKTMRLGGFAALRSDVIAMEEALIAYEGIESVESPVSNILAPTNVEFIFTAMLK